MTDCFCMTFAGASHAETGQVPVALARVVRVVVEIRRHGQMVRVDWQRQFVERLAHSLRRFHLPGISVGRSTR